MDCQEYRVVEVDEIPGGHEWLLIDEPFTVTVVMRSDCLSARVIADCWAAYRKVMRPRNGPSPNHREPAWMEDVPRFLRAV